MSAKDAFQRISVAVIGQPVSHIWRGYGSALFLELGALTPGSARHDGSPGAPRGAFTVSIEWSWRIEDARSIICGSWSEEALWAPTFERLRGAHVSALALHSRLPEVELSLDNGTRVLSFMTAEGQPQWSLCDARTQSPLWISVRDGNLFEGDSSAPPRPI